MRLRRGRAGRPPPMPHPGDLVIDGQIRARLLGLHLLDLEAHVVVGSARGDVSDRRSTRRARQGREAGAVARDAQAVPTLPAAGSNGSRRRVADGDALPLAHARALLDEGSTVLAATRRMR